MADAATSAAEAVIDAINEVVAEVRKDRTWAQPQPLLKEETKKIAHFALNEENPRDSTLGGPSEGHGGQEHQLRPAPGRGSLGIMMLYLE